MDGMLPEMVWIWHEVDTTVWKTNHPLAERGGGLLQHAHCSGITNLPTVSARIRNRVRRRGRTGSRS